MRIYNKLVRDRIPEIIEKKGQKCTYTYLSDEQFLCCAEKKLDEELQEYHQDHTVEELADLIEVIRAIALAKGISWEDLEKVRLQKQAERGSFSQKIFLESVE